MNSVRLPPPKRESKTVLNVAFWIAFVMVLVNVFAAVTAPTDEFAGVATQAAGVFAALAFVFWALCNIDETER